MDKIVLHYVQITENAQFDYENALFWKKYPKFETLDDNDWRIESKYDQPLVIMPKVEFRKELSDYIQFNKKLWNKTYIRATYYDESIDRMLMCFIIRGEKVGYTQYWNLVGICRADRWDEDLEEDGVIRGWYTTDINPTGDCYDWVLAKRIQEENEEKERQREEAEREKYERMFEFNKK